MFTFYWADRTRQTVYGLRKLLVKDPPLAHLKLSYKYEEWFPLGSILGFCWSWISISMEGVFGIKDHYYWPSGICRTEYWIFLLRSLSNCVVHIPSSGASPSVDSFNGEQSGVIHFVPFGDTLLLSRPISKTKTNSFPFVCTDGTDAGGLPSRHFDDSHILDISTESSCNM